MADSIKLTQGKVKGFSNSDHGADQPTQSDKPTGPFPKSSPASPTKKDGGI
jgi:hypothetical protein